MKKLANVLFLCLLSNTFSFAQTFAPFAGMTDNPLHEIISDKNGVKYLCSEKGLFKIENYVSEKINNAQIRTLLLTNEGEKLAGTYSGFVFSFGDKMGKKIGTTSEQQNLVTGLTIDSEQKMWVATFGNGLWSIDKKMERAVPILVKNHELVSHIADICIDNNDNKWIATDQGVFTLDAMSKKFEKKFDFVSASSMIFSPLDNEIWAAVSKKDGSLALFRCTDKEAKEVELPAQIKNSFINQLYYDPNGRIWVCSEVLAMYDKGSWVIYDVKNGINSNSISCVHIDQDRNIWVGTDGKGLFVAYSNPDKMNALKENKLVEKTKEPTKENLSALETALDKGVDLSKDYPIKIQFDEDKDAIKAEFHKDLDLIAEILKKNPTLTMEIKGHTERSNNPVYIQKLSEKRANAVKNYLVTKKKIDAKRLTAIGFGSRVPISLDPRNTAVNRRVEVRFK